MAHAAKLPKPEVERRRAAAGRMLGLFADVAPDRNLVDELIADRRAEAGGGGLREHGSLTALPWLR